jgi:hypothetical protein
LPFFPHYQVRTKRASVSINLDTAQPVFVSNEILKIRRFCLPNNGTLD